MASSRRRLLKTGLAAAGAVALARRDSALAQQRTSAAAITAKRFRGWVSRGTGPGRTTLQELTLKPISGRQIVVRTEATNLCYSNTGVVLGLQGGGVGRLNSYRAVTGNTLTAGQ